VTALQRLPPPVAGLAGQLAALSGVVAVVLGGSRATATHRPDSDWDLGIYYRASQQRLDPDEVRRLGHEGYVSALGEWGPIMHGGAWLTVEGAQIDVLFRDLDLVERWLDDARHGSFEVRAQNGYIVGAPTYLPVGELAICEALSGQLPRPTFPHALAAAAPGRWEGRAAVSLMFAESYAALGDSVCCAGMLTSAVLAAAHGRVARRREWVLNEKRLVERAGLQATQPLLGCPGSNSTELVATTAAITTILGIRPLTAR
jgi:predicted nucleotidyltransferase